VRTHINATPQRNRKNHSMIDPQLAPDRHPTHEHREIAAATGGALIVPPSGRTWATGHTIPCTTTSVTMVATE